MRPLRLLLDGFGSYRQPASVDFTDIDFFALTGPTGSGKSTVIDGLCFALYGTVPRWGRENAIAHALAPAANACRVCLVFEAAGARYAAVRALARDARGQVHTREARLDRLEESVPSDAPIKDILEAVVEPLAEGPDQVKSCVQELLGLSYEHFTQSVLLPQGRFAEFLHTEPRKRQDLLVQLLAFGVYEQIGQRARERAKAAADRLSIAVQARRELDDVTEAAGASWAKRVARLTDLAAEVDERLTALAALAQQAGQAEEEARAGREESALLAKIRAPADAPGLADRIARADALVAERRRGQARAEAAEEEARRSRDALPDKTRSERYGDAHAERRKLATRMERQEAACADAQAAEDVLADKAQAAEREAGLAQDALTAARRANAAGHLAETLHVGDDCPVCLQPVAALPHHAAAADLGQARKASETAAQEHRRLLRAHGDAAAGTAGARSTAEATRRRLAEVESLLRGSPSETEVAMQLKLIAVADQALDAARRDVAARRAAVSAAERERAGLVADEKKAWAALHRSRDPVVGLGAPEVDTADLAAAWDSLAAWAAAQRAARGELQPRLDAAARTLGQQLAEGADALTAMLAEQGITGLTEPARITAAVAEARVQAEKELEAVRHALRQAARLDRQIAEAREEEQVASTLGGLLRANAFERWLCSEALDSLVAEASATLMALSGGQYQLDRDDRNELVVVDFEDAGARRPVHTLSGGETFQASLALALALSRQVVELSSGMRDLNSMFLDEGFGTLDEDSLETVASTLERLAADSGRMVGIVTHVAALAERVPVRFVVSRSGATSALREVRA
jgi:DNA repair protein SbcC/Rad50